MSDEPNQKPELPEGSPQQGVYRWAIVAAAIIALAAGAGAKFGLGVSGVAAGALAVMFFLPIMAGLVFFQSGTRDLEHRSSFARVSLICYGLLCVAGSVLLFLSVFFDWPLPIKSQLFPNKSDAVVIPLPPTDPTEKVLCNIYLPEPVKATDLSRPNNPIANVVFLPAQSRMVFISGYSVDWTNDRFDTIEAMLSYKPVLIDVSVFIDQYDRCKGDRSQFHAFIQSRFDDLVSKGWSVNRETSRTALFRWGVEHYVDEKLMPAVSPEQRGKLVAGKYIEIDTRNTSYLDPTSFVMRPFWKRMIMAELVETSEANRIMGRFFPFNNPTATKPEYADKYPSRQGRTASLVGGVMREVRPPTTQPANSGAVFLGVPLGEALPFSDAGDAIENKSDKPVFVRLGINDDLPEDNGEGYAQITYRVEPTQTETSKK